MFRLYLVNPLALLKGILLNIPLINFITKKEHQYCSGKYQITFNADVFSCTMSLFSHLALEIIYTWQLWYG